MKKEGLKFSRYYTDGLHLPLAQVQWEERTASITDMSGKTIFEQKGIQVPKGWSQTATNIVASKYFHGKLGTDKREDHVGQLVGRVANTIHDWGVKGYFTSVEEAKKFKEELTFLLVNQYAAFNSPVWFNLGVKEARGYGYYYDPTKKTPVRMTDEGRPQCSACFINSVQDSLESILDLAKTEGMLFKWGSGTGSNLSNLREENGSLSSGGKASGPLSFMKGFDAFAGVIKSGGKTRRAAKMVILNSSHPDVEKFTWCKANEEKKAHALVAAGYDNALDGEAYGSIFFQNANNSVRADDDFMKAVISDGDYELKSVLDGHVVKTIKARKLMREIAEATWVCGDPGMQFDTTINTWHTCKNTDRINASNPCSEYMFLDDSACNLASLNLMKFRDENGVFDHEGFRHAVRVLITAMEIIVENASYPTDKIAENSYKYRPLGLGFANIGSLLMCSGLAYDSDAGRNYAGLISSIMSGEAYSQSSRIAEVVGTFEGFAKNRSPFLEVVAMHRKAQKKYWKMPDASQELARVSDDCWAFAETNGELFGYRNAQVSVIAPTGTIGFMMDCDTTGIEPELALVKFKRLVGGGTIKLVNTMVPIALGQLGYTPEQSRAIVAYVDDKGTIEGAPELKDEHLPVFDCSFKAQNGTRTIHYSGHIKMMAAVQPFTSGAISKTINMPEEATVDEIMDAYVESWRLGVKAVAIYRDNSKKVQPLSSGNESDVKVEEKIVYRPVRRKLPDERPAVTHKFTIGGHEGYLTVGLFDDGAPGEIFITMAKEGSTISGLMDCFATSVSYCLQYGVPLKFLVDKFGHVRFEPSGWTGNQHIPYAKSLPDYIFRWMAMKFVNVAEELKDDKVASRESARAEKTEKLHQDDAPPCHNCGGIMTRNGSCYKCGNCGETSGCS